MSQLGYPWHTPFIIVEGFALPQPPLPWSVWKVTLLVSPAAEIIDSRLAQYSQPVNT